MEENRKLTQTYEIFQKDFGKTIPQWKVPKGIKCGFDKVNSLEDVSDYLSKYYPEKSWKLIKENITKKETIYDFEYVVNLNRFPPHIIKIKIKSKIGLEKTIAGENKK